MKAAQLADALQEGRTTPAVPSSAEIQAASKGTRRSGTEVQFTDRCPSGHQNPDRYQDPRRRGEHVQADADDGWIGRAGSRPEVCGFTADGVS